MDNINVKKLLKTVEGTVEQYLQWFNGLTPDEQARERKRIVFIHDTTGKGIAIIANGNIYKTTQLGFQGFQGFQGLQGTSAAMVIMQGYTGMQGIQGYQGTVYVGWNGPNGFQGLQGLQGIAASTAVQGTRVSCI